MATKASSGNWVRVHHNTVLEKLGLTRFSSTEVSKEQMETYWHNIGWGLWHECYCLLFAAWDEAKIYADSLMHIVHGKLKQNWRHGGRFNRLNNHPIDSHSIIKLTCAREQGMPIIEHDESDVHTVTSEFSLVCQRQIGEKVNYEDTITEVSSGEEEPDVSDSEDAPLIEESETDSAGEEEDIVRDPPVLGVPLPMPESGKLSTVIQRARYKRMMGKDDDEGMGVAVAAAAVFLALAYAMS